MSHKRLSATLFFLIAFLSNGFANVKIESFKSPGGINIWLVKDNSVAVMSLSFSSPLATIVSMDKAGIASLTGTMMHEGAGNLDSHAFKEKVEEMGLEMNAGIDEENFRGSLRTPMDNRFEAIRLFKMILNEPIFDLKQFEIARQQHITTLENDLKAPGYVLELLVAETLFKNHPYGVPQVGTRESLKNITLEDVKNFFRDCRSKTGMCVSICGNISQKDAGIFVDEIFKDWRELKTPSTYPDWTYDFSGKEYFKEVAGGQGLSIFAQKGLVPTDKDYTKLVIAAHIMGGSSNSRLFQEIREKRGLSYYVDTGMSSWRHASYLFGRVGTNSKKMHESLDIVKTVWKDFKDKGVTAKELENAKNFLLGIFNFSFSSTNQTSGTLLGYMEKGFSPQYVYERTKRIESITLKDLNAFIKEFFTPEKLTFFNVGNTIQTKAQPPLPPMKPTGVPSEETHPVIEPTASE